MEIVRNLVRENNMKIIETRDHKCKINVWNVSLGDCIIEKLIWIKLVRLTIDKHRMSLCPPLDGRT